MKPRHYYANYHFIDKTRARTDTHTLPVYLWQIVFLSREPNRDATSIHSRFKPCFRSNFVFSSSPDGIMSRTIVFMQISLHQSLDHVIHYSFLTSDVGLSTFVDVYSCVCVCVYSNNWEYSLGTIARKQPSDRNEESKVSRLIGGMRSVDSRGERKREEDGSRETT